MNWFYAAQGQQLGPVETPELLALLESGRIGRDTLVWREGMAEWQPLESAGVLVSDSGEEMAVCAHSGELRPKSQMIPYGDQWVLPEHRDALVHSVMAGGRVEPRGAGEVPDDYTVPVDECFGRGWRSLAEDFWPNVGVGALILVIYYAASSIPYANVLAGFVQAPLFAGLFWYYLCKIRGERPDLSFAFAGFSRWFLQLFVLGLVAGLLVLVSMAPGFGAIIVGVFMVGEGDNSEALGTLLIVSGIVGAMIPATYLQVAWMFASLLCIDHRMDFWPAMKVSMNTVNKHWFLCFLFAVVAMLVVMAGLLALCLGVFLAVPWATLAFVHLYEHIYGSPSRGGSAV